MNKTLLAMLLPFLAMNYSMAEDTGVGQVATDETAVGGSLDEELSDEELAMFSDFDAFDIDMLADLPVFDPYPNGVHTVTIAFAKKIIGDDKHPSIEIKTTYVAPVELENAEDKVPDAGQEYSFLCMLDNDMGQGSLKQVLAPLAAAYGIGNASALMNHVQGFQVNITTKQRWDKKNEVMRCGIRELVVA